MTISKKTKRIITISLVAGSLLICGIFAICFLVPSYLSRKEAYDTLSEEWKTSTETSTDDEDESQNTETESSSKITIGSTILTLDEAVVKNK